MGFFSPYLPLRSGPMRARALLGKRSVLGGPYSLSLSKFSGGWEREEIFPIEKLFLARWDPPPKKQIAIPNMGRYTEQWSSPLAFGPLAGGEIQYVKHNSVVNASEITAPSPPANSTTRGPSANGSTPLVQRGIPLRSIGPCHGGIPLDSGVTHSIVRSPPGQERPISKRWVLRADTAA